MAKILVVECNKRRHESRGVGGENFREEGLKVGAETSLSCASALGKTGKKKQPEADPPKSKGSKPKSGWHRVAPGL